MTKKELKKFKKVIKVMDMCPSIYGLKESDSYCKDTPSDCRNCWKLAVESRLKELKEIGGI